MEKLEKKLNLFIAKRKYAETDQRKRMVDYEVIGYLTKHSKDIDEFMKYYDQYKEGFK